MQIRTRLTIQFTFFVGLILLFFSIAIYYFSYRYQQQEFRGRLKNRALVTAKRYSQDVREIDDKILKIIDRTSVTVFTAENTEVFNTRHKMVYNKSDKDSVFYPNVLLDKIKDQKEFTFSHQDTIYVGVFYTGMFEELVAISRAVDTAGMSKLWNLLLILSGCFLLAMATTVLLAFFYSKQALSPIANVVSQVETIKASNLRLKVNEGNGTDEIARLAIEFNRMLERLADAFEIQRSFISNASHELRTPLTSITGQIEVSLMNPKINEDAREVLISLLEDMRNLNKLSNGLLSLFQASLELNDMSLSVLRIDELLGQTRAEIIQHNPGYTVNVTLAEYPEEESRLLIRGNEQLLKIALLNVIENGCKYSPDHQVNVSIQFVQGKVKLLIADKGIGITPGDIERVFETFYRGVNTSKQKGHGIGLTLTKRIVEVHKGTIRLESTINQGTTVTILLPEN
jgi:signal transduction histidine kinase